MDGFWLVYLWEGSIAVPIMAFDNELEAYRYAVKNNYKAAYVEFGVDISEAVKNSEAS